MSKNNKVFCFQIFWGDLLIFYYKLCISFDLPSIMSGRLGLWCLTSLSTIFQLYRGVGSFIGGGSH